MSSFTISEEDRLVLIGGLRRLYRVHHESPDCWYSCPKSEDGCCDDSVNSDECTCGADKHNVMVADMLSVLGDGAECEACFGSGAQANVPVYVPCPTCAGKGVVPGGPK